MPSFLYYKSNKSVIICVKKSLNNGKSILFNLDKVGNVELAIIGGLNSKYTKKYDVEYEYNSFIKI